MSIDAVTQFTRALTQLDRCLEKADTHARARGYDPAVLLQARLAPDQFPYVRQVQAACDAAKFAAARLTGREAPRNPDTEQTVAELRARVRATLDYLATFSAADFEGSGTRVVPLGFMPGKAMLGRDYLLEMALPNFYFHVATAYSILRHNGVELGKADFIGPLTLRDL